MSIEILQELVKEIASLDTSKVNCLAAKLYDNEVFIKDIEDTVKALKLIFGKEVLSKVEILERLKIYTKAFAEPRFRSQSITPTMLRAIEMQIHKYLVELTDKEALMEDYSKPASLNFKLSVDAKNLITIEYTK